MTRTVRQASVWTAGAIVALALAAGALAAPYVILPSGEKVEGTALRADKDGAIVLTTSSGQMTFPKGTRAFVDPPGDYDKAVGFIQQRKFDDAITILERIAAQYRFLEWDVKARRLMGEAYLGKADYAGAIKNYEDLFRDAPDSRKDDDISVGYVKALINKGEKDKLGRLIDPTIASGPRKAAAWAQVYRGQQRLAQGDVDTALSDFLRTADLFQEVTDVQPEAVYMTGVCLEKLGDKRAADYYARVVKDYPDNPFAAKAKARQAPTATAPAGP